ncbi:hypothetical protein ACO0LB_06315 [Undibacterium sp. SXout7W]|uniref:hypothetical protein n=1 Tax=Undibacterium sp. SXout7W TaxID=3413049 RepID=UPI003BF003AD
MTISGTSIRSLASVLRLAGEAKKVRFAVPLESIDPSVLKKIGFDEVPKVGDFLVPAAIGKFTNFNANGSEIVRKDLEKVSESIMYYGSFRDWHGRIHHGVRTRRIEKYVREYIDGPEEIFQIVTVNGEIYIATAVLDLNDKKEKRNVHNANLMFECFTKFDIIDVEKNKVVGPTLKRLQWEVLPPGNYPWGKSKSFINRAIGNFPERDQKVIEFRMEEISKREPDILATGRAGFCGYFVYGFSKKNVYVLESIFLDNATYVFSSDWESLSQLTKSELINGRLPHTRIVHNEKWNVNLGRAIDGR